MPHVPFEHYVLHQMVDHIERQRELRGEEAAAVGERLGIVTHEALGGVVREPRDAALDRGA